MREEALDLAELALFDAIQRGEFWAIQSYLSTVGKSRGYTTRQTVDATARSQPVVRIERYQQPGE